MSEEEKTEEESMGVKSIAHVLPSPHVPMLSSHGQQSAIKERLEGTCDKKYFKSMNLKKDWRKEKNFQIFGYGP